MEKDKHVTEVIFRKFKDGDIIAFFPYEIESPQGYVMSYMHVGQHGSADYQGLISTTKLATEEEYADLKNELENHVGYNLKVIKKINSDKWRKAYEAHRKFYQELENQA
jgi:hypothetical protein